MLQIDTYRWTFENGEEIFKSELQHIPDVLIHATKLDRVESILRNGLIPNSIRNSKTGNSLGIYLITNEEFLKNDVTEIFIDNNTILLEVNVSTIKHLLKPDEEFRPFWFNCPFHSEDDFAWYADFKIEPFLIKKYL